MPRIVRWQPYVNPARTMCGFLSTALPSGLVLHGLKLMIGPTGKPWLAMPSVKRLDHAGQPVLDARGKSIWDPIIEFTGAGDRTRFQEQVLEALRRDHPEVFNTSSGGRPPGASPDQPKGDEP
jgi:hypothetical protein